MEVQENAGGEKLLVLHSPIQPMCSNYVRDADIQD